MYDAYRRIMQPDFHAQPPMAELPQWQPMGDPNQGAEQAGQATGTFVDMLKKRMGGAGAAKGGSMGGDEGKAAMMGGEGMQSL